MVREAVIAPFLPELKAPNACTFASSFCLFVAAGQWLLLVTH